MSELEPAEIVEQFHQRTLPKPAWTHEAHLIVCWFALREIDVERAISRLRSAIRAYNESTGTPNTDDSGYHETLTRYYVEAVAALDAKSLDDVLNAPACERRAPSRYWSREALFSTAARRDWLEPNLECLPWRAGPA